MMSVYVDPLLNTKSLVNPNWPYLQSCHLTADTEEELHNFAVHVLKLKRSWHQQKSLSHYDLTASKRTEALNNGAVSLTVEQAGERYRQRMEEMNARKQGDKVITVTFASINDKRHHKGQVYTMCVTLMHKPHNLDIFTPTRSLVYGHKSYTGDTRYQNVSPVNEQEYKAGYAQLLRDRSAEVRAWIDAIQEDVTLCCFCATGKFCHRRILAGWFKSYRPTLLTIVV